jgi:hypothetical protein
MERVIYPEVIICSWIGDLNVSSYVRSITIKKSIKTPVHSCQIVIDTTLDSKSDFLTADKGAFLRKWLKKNLVIAVKIDNREKKYKFVGLIDQIVEIIQSGNRNTGRQITLNCSALLPKILIRDNIINAPQLRFIFETKIPKSDPLYHRAKFFNWERFTDLIEKKKDFTKSSEIIKYILNNTIATNTSIVQSFNGILPADKTPKSFLGKDENEVDCEGVPIWDFHFLEKEMLFDVNLSRYTGTILNYIYSALDMEFYEVFFDSTSTKTGLPISKMIIRPKPFTFEKYNGGSDKWFLWEDLKYTKTIDRSMVIEETLSQSDYEVKNVFQTYFEKDLIASSGSTASKFGLQFPIVNLESIRKYGLRELTVKSIVANYDDAYKNYNESIEKNKKIPFEKTDGGKSIIDYIQEKRDKICQWYGFPHFESGQIAVIGGEFEIGKKIFFKDRIYIDEETGNEHEGVEYYLEETLDQFSYPQTWRTTLTVSRGAPIDFVPKWFAKNEFIKINLDRDYQIRQQTNIDRKKPIDGIDFSKLSLIERTA